MTKHRAKWTIAFSLCAVLVPTASLHAAAVVPVYGEPNCYRWFDTEENIRCFTCLKKVWTGVSWQWMNVCPKGYIELGP
jgi:uncharacterized protein with PIN domain